MREVEHLLQCFPEIRARSREDVRQIRETCDSTFERRLVADVQNHSGSDRSGSILPITLLRAVLAGADDHVGDVLGVGDVARSEEPNLGQRIESGTAGLLNRRKLEAEVSLLRAEAGRLGPVLALDVVDDGDSDQASKVGITRPTPLPERVGAKARICSGPLWRR